MSKQLDYKITTIPVRRRLTSYSRELTTRSGSDPVETAAIEEGLGSVLPSQALQSSYQLSWYKELQLEK